MTIGLGKVNAAKYRYTPEVIVLPRPLLAYLRGLRVKMCVWLGVSRGLDLAFLNAD